MNVFITLPPKLTDKITQKQINQLKQSMFGIIKKYKIEADEILVCPAPAGSSQYAVYIMGKSLYSNMDNSIRDDIIKQFGSLISGQAPDIKINYSLINPNFNPSPCNENKSDYSKSESDNEYDYEKLSMNYQAELPRYSFDQVILPEETRVQIEEAIGVIQVESKVFDEWGLRSIIPYATSALSFYGPPGTGKSMAAEAVAQKMGKKILSATYADIESKYHGEGPKMVKAIFKAAERDDAVLFLDESDSLLSKRLTNVSDGSAQAINSMRSQLLISLEKFKGVVIFATNLVVNYDRAFLSRLINIEFKMPDAIQREEIWNKHLISDKIHIPLSSDVNIKEIAEKYDFCGREIKNAVKNACVSVALAGRNLVTHDDFIKACEKTRKESDKVINAKDHTNINSSTPQISEKVNDQLKSLIQNKINETNS